ncbi:hypothetical protein AMECASPLE_005932 [Ameca splendens]|uniref:Uncharacterized protein n=1 Tax=Ameca splendens TaxID=208324 RepID=A0ABV0XCB0_9TELE
MAAQAQRLQEVQRGLPAHRHQPPPTLATVLPEETPERKLQFSQATLERYRTLREQRWRAQFASLTQTFCSCIWTAS